MRRSALPNSFIAELTSAFGNSSLQCDVGVKEECSKSSEKVCSCNLATNNQQKEAIRKIVILSRSDSCNVQAILREMASRRLKGQWIRHRLIAANQLGIQDVEMAIPLQSKQELQPIGKQLNRESSQIQRYLWFHNYLGVLASHRLDL